VASKVRDSGQRSKSYKVRPSDAIRELVSISGFPSDSAAERMRGLVERLTEGTIPEIDGEVRVAPCVAVEIDGKKRVDTYPARAVFRALVEGGAMDAEHVSAAADVLEALAQAVVLGNEESLAIVRDLHERIASLDRRRLFVLLTIDNAIRAFKEPFPAPENVESVLYLLDIVNLACVRDMAGDSDAWLAFFSAEADVHLEQEYADEDTQALSGRPTRAVIAEMMAHARRL
jgi:hypothetical protein